MCGKSFSNRFPLHKLNRKSVSKQDLYGRLEKGRKQGRDRNIGRKKP